MEKPVCVWENKGPKESAILALSEAQFYVEGLRKALPTEPGLPSLAAGYNGKTLLLSYLNNDGKWVPIKVDGSELRDAFPKAALVAGGISAQGLFTAVSGSASAQDLRGVLAKLKTAYRIIPALASGRAPIDFTVALLTLKLVIEQNPDWGSWSDMPRFSPGTKSTDQAISERISTLVSRAMADAELKRKYGDIFIFHEQSDNLELAFSFPDILSGIEVHRGHFLRIHEILDQLPPLTGANFDIFGEVYQAIGDEATKKKLGEFFTGRHIISGVLPILFSRAGLDESFARVRNLKIADIACGTGGFLTETLRLVRRLHAPKDGALKTFAKKAFFGYDIGHANASRARVNMYFAGDGFSFIAGGVDALSENSLKLMPPSKFDLIATNPPYGLSDYGRIEEAFLQRTLDLLKPGTGWLLIVLPTGVLENPRASRARFALLNGAKITDVISLPKHAFAPYTQQRTAVIVAQKRKSNMVPAGSTWSSLLAKTKSEKISMFVVDNDGFANSDKRYPTDRVSPGGEWLHNDLADWTDSEGNLHPSKLYRSLILGEQPENAMDENGTPLAAKYGTFTPGELADDARGITLLPDSPLRRDLRSIPFDQWIDRAKNLERFSQGEAIALPLSFRGEVEFLVDHSVTVPENHLRPAATITDLFHVTKGDQGLTEGAIYRSLSPTGYPIFGGGSGDARFKADSSLTRKDGKKPKLFESPALIVSMDGSSGSLQVVESGSFYCNHHGAVLRPKTAMNLWCFAQVAEPALRRLASNQSASATLTKPALEGLSVRLPTGIFATRIGEARKLLTRLLRLIKAK